MAMVLFKIFVHALEAACKFVPESLQDLPQNWF
jgi:hypothetical protein